MQLENQQGQYECIQVAGLLAFKGIYSLGVQTSAPTTKQNPARYN